MQKGACCNCNANAECASKLVEHVNSEVPGQDALEDLWLLGDALNDNSMKASKPPSYACSHALFTHLLRLQGSHVDPGLNSPIGKGAKYLQYTSAKGYKDWCWQCWSMR